MDIIQLPSPNTSGRRAFPPTHIVLHIMDGTLIGTDAWFGNAASKVSAHYGIGKRGEIHQYVDDMAIAWHAGRIDNPTVELRPGNPNGWTIGIEHEGRAGDELPLELYVASARLLRKLSATHGIPLDKNHVWLHREIYSKKTCPGKLNRDLLLAMARHIEP